MRSVSSGRAADSPSSVALTDAAFLQALCWTSAADKALVRAAEKGDVAAFCRALRKQLPKKPLRIASALPPRSAKRAASQNGQTNGHRPDPQHALHRQHQRLAAIDPPPEPSDLLAALDQLRSNGRQLPNDVLWPLWRALLTAVQSQAVSAEDEGTEREGTPQQQAVAEGELPWAAGLLFAGLDGTEALRRSGRQVLREQLLHWADDDGIPHSEFTTSLTTCLATLVRSGLWAEQFDVPLWNKETRPRWRQFVKTSIVLCGNDGRLPFGGADAFDVRPLLAAAARQAKLRPDSRAMRLLAGLQKPGKRRPGRVPPKPAAAEERRKPPSFQSDDARLACLRSDWTPAADVLIVTHHNHPPSIRLAPAGRPLLEGSWDLSLKVDDKPVDLAGEWTCCCWYTDEDVDYAELQQKLAGGLRIERQLLLSRKERLAVLADSIAEAGTAHIEYRSRLPAAAGVEIESDLPTRECRLAADQLRARVFPLALPSDRVQSTPGNLQLTAAGLELTQVAVGGLLAPLVIDWHPKRQTRPADWRTLTVTEQGRVVKSDRASGHRLRVGKHQLFVYRSILNTGASRAVLGHHTLHETVIGRLDASGDVAPILLVE